MITSKADCVVDASIAIKLFIEQEDSDLAESLLIVFLFTMPVMWCCLYMPSVL